METLPFAEAAVPTGTPPCHSLFGSTLPQDLALKVATSHLLTTIELTARQLEAARWHCNGPYHAAIPARHDLLVLVTFAYLRGIYASADVVQLLDIDDHLHSMSARLGLRPEHVRHFRREHRQDILACLANVLAALALETPPPRQARWSPDSGPSYPTRFSSLSLATAWARECFERAVLLDSMALDE